MSSKSMFLLLIHIWGLATLIGMVGSFFGRNPWTAVVATLAASILPLLILAVKKERRLLREFTDLRYASWSFLLGDTFFLPVTAIGAAIGWQNVDRTNWLGSWWWFLSCVGLGLAAGHIFHKKESAGFEELRLNSPTKLYHDMVATPVLVAGLSFGGLPVLFTTQPPIVIVLVVGGFVCWFLAVLRDKLVKLDPTKLHIEYEWR